MICREVVTWVSATVQGISSSRRYERELGVTTPSVTEVFCLVLH